jgi:general secretion pathway protein H
VRPTYRLPPMNERPAVLPGEDGFTLIEMVCVLAVVAILAAIVLPRVSRETSQPRLEGCAIEAAAILKADRTAAIIAGRQIATNIDANLRSIRSGATGQVLHVADDVVVTALLPERCNDRPAFSTVSFFPTACLAAALLRWFEATAVMKSASIG